MLPIILYHEAAHLDLSKTTVHSNCPISAEAASPGRGGDLLSKHAGHKQCAQIQQGKGVTKEGKSFLWEMKGNNS